MAQPAVIDVIILSYAKNEHLTALTQQTITTLLQSEEPASVKFNVVVIESNKALQPYQFKDSTTIYPDIEFGFHKYLNIGIKATSAPFLCLCNNDLIFHHGWATEILNAMRKHKDVMSANPYCQYFHPQLGLKINSDVIIGNKFNLLKGVLTGWCILVKRELFAEIGLLDEDFIFWYADKDYGRTLLKHKTKHALVIRSKVDHLGNQSHTAVDQMSLDVLTAQQKQIYERKWGKERPQVERIKMVLKKIFNA